MTNGKKREFKKAKNTSEYCQSELENKDLSALMHSIWFEPVPSCPH